MKPAGAPGRAWLKLTRNAPGRAELKKQPLGEYRLVSLPPYFTPTVTAALSHAASVPIFEEPDGQSSVLDAPRR